MSDTQDGGGEAGKKGYHRTIHYANRQNAPTTNKRDVHPAKSDAIYKLKHGADS